jgi:hypothetical protein
VLHKTHILHQRLYYVAPPSRRAISYCLRKQRKSMLAQAAHVNLDAVVFRRVTARMAVHQLSLERWDPDCADERNQRSNSSVERYST